MHIAVTTRKSHRLRVKSHRGTQEEFSARTTTYFLEQIPKPLQNESLLVGTHFPFPLEGSSRARVESSEALHTPTKIAEPIKLIQTLRGKIFAVQSQYVT